MASLVYLLAALCWSSLHLVAQADSAGVNAVAYFSQQFFSLTADSDEALYGFEQACSSFSGSSQNKATFLINSTITWSSSKNSDIEPTCFKKGTNATVFFIDFYIQIVVQSFQLKKPAVINCLPQVVKTM